MAGEANDISVIQELLSPWNISFTNPEEAEVIVSYNRKLAQNKKTIIIPSESIEFLKLIKETQIKLEQNKSWFSVPINEQTSIETTTSSVFCHIGKRDRILEEEVLSTIELEEDQLLLRFDIINDFKKILTSTLNAKPSIAFQIMAHLPFSYSRVPKPIRELLLREHGNKPSLFINNKLSMDALRFILINALERLLHKEVPKKLLNGKKCACIITHDVETLEGLHRAKKMKKLENKYDIPTTWFIPSRRYRLSSESVKELANHGEIGSHDTLHDGKLASLTKNRMINRLSQAKHSLEKIVGLPINGFRAPVLQHNRRMIEALRDSNFVYDSSIPTWEPRHPSTMKPHGIETVYPLKLSGLTEIPITLIQDHQLLYILGLNPKEVVNNWLTTTNQLKNMGGFCTFLVHPEYKLGDGKMEFYEDLVSYLVSDSEMMITTPSELSLISNETKL